MLKWQVSKDENNERKYKLKFGSELINIKAQINNEIFDKKNGEQNAEFQASDEEKYIFASLIGINSFPEAANILSSGLYTEDQSGTFGDLINLGIHSFRKINRTPCVGKMQLAEGLAECIALSVNDGIAICVITENYTFNSKEDLLRLEQIDQYSRIDIPERLFIPSS